MLLTSLQFLSAIYLSSVFCVVEKFVNTKVIQLDNDLKTGYTKVEFDGEIKHDIPAVALLEKYGLLRSHTEGLKFDEKFRFEILYKIMSQWQGVELKGQKVHYLLEAIKTRNFKTALVILHFIIASNNFEIEKIAKELGEMKNEDGVGLYALLADKWNTAIGDHYIQIVTIALKCGLPKDPNAKFAKTFGEKENAFKTERVSSKFITPEDAGIKDSDFEEFVLSLKHAFQLMFEGKLEVDDAVIGKNMYNLNFADAKFENKVAPYLFAYTDTYLLKREPTTTEILYVAFSLNNLAEFEKALEKKSEFSESELQFLLGLKITGAFAEKFAAKVSAVELKDGVLVLKPAAPVAPNVQTEPVTEGKLTKLHYGLIAGAIILVLAGVCVGIFFFMKKKN